MGNDDKWTTPKQIKIEREGEPRGIRRGKLKKGKRKKGKKARIDELLAEKKDAELYRQWFHDDQKRMIEHPEWYLPVRGLHVYNPQHEKWFMKHKIRLAALVELAVKDGVITAEDAENYTIELYPF